MRAAPSENGLEQCICELRQATQFADIQQCITDCDEWLEHQFAELPIEHLVKGRSTFVDALLKRAWQLVGLNEVHQLALVAVGGYGNGQLHPYSDIDLLIVSPKTLPDSIQAKVRDLITLLWDCKLDVGQSVRTIEQTVEAANQDITLATGLIEARFLTGQEDVFESLQTHIQQRSSWTSDSYFVAKMHEQQQRHQRFHGTSYNLEPNIKENPGCLRDIQTISWVAKKHFNVWSGKELIVHGYFSVAEWQELQECRNHLWRMRFALHLEARRNENRLLFDFQPGVAKRLGHQDANKAAVESMMKDFFRIIRRIAELNLMLLQYFKQDILAQQQPVPTQINEDFALINQLVIPQKSKVFNSPEAILRFFLLLTNNPQIKGLHPSCLRQLRDARRQFSEYYCEREACRKLFVQLLHHPDFFGLAWDLMHEHGIVQAYFAEWDQIVGMMQFDLFHAYTVDEHTHRLIKHIHRYHDTGDREFPICKQIVRQLPNPALLYIAAIFHDIAKGREGDHSTLGAIDIARFCQQHEFSASDSEILEWLVKNHLLMSMVAQRRDIYDPLVIDEFSAQVGNQLRLDLLYALTVADIRATNDNLWNDWKSRLLQELYKLTRTALENGPKTAVSFDERIEQHRQKAKATLLESGFGGADIERFWQRFKKDYFARFLPSQLVWHAQMIMSAEQAQTCDQGPLVVAITAQTDPAGTELLVYCQDSPAVFAQIASVLDSRLCMIHDAQIMLTENQYMFESFIINNADGSKIEDPHRINQLQLAIRQQLLKPSIEHDNRRKMSRQMKQLKVPTKVRFYSTQPEFTMLDLEALDTPGLLARISRLFVEMDIRLKMAKISTIGERAEDLFIISNSQGMALTQQQKVALKQNLTELLA